MISTFPPRGYFRPLKYMTRYELHLYALRGEAEAREVEQALQRRQELKVECEARLSRPDLESMTHEELSAYAKRGRAEDIQAAAEKLRRWRAKERQSSNVVRFPSRTSDNGGVA